MNKIKIKYFFLETGIYKITPDIIDLPSGESVLYECTFLPTTSDQFYNRTLTAFIEWKDNRPRPENKTKKSVCCMTIPIAVHLRVTGLDLSLNLVV